ncbi:cytochrome c oxidase subunit 6A2, mitochondrial-like [Hydractinia symbiolongicarpus]|uniref:cytochrome c oxidase subunit 6A2, mitochondrial-like n=1 Tax=Hydractinia symbiolongicarpus TaxID=13093 RepID=UPI002551AC52|nr:cytochrome c oxidase subunit 6A2, mitochondrial-like [Hydractinia symbiolongicarpus]
MASHILRANNLLRQGLRRFSALAGKEYQEALLAEEKHAGATAKTWKGISIFVAVPGMLLCAYQAYTTEKEHMAHFERPEFHAYEHLRIRRSPFPWKDGNHSLFHGHNNALPEGYEH